MSSGQHDSPGSARVPESGAEDLSAAEREALAVADDPILRQMLDEERVESESVDTALLLRLLRYLREHRFLAAISVLLALLEAGLMTLPAWVIGLAVDRISDYAERDLGPLASWLSGLAESFAGEGGDADVVLFFGLVVAAVWALRWCTAGATTYIVQMLGQRVLHDLRLDIYRHIVSMDLGFFHGNPVGRLVNRTTFDVQQLSQLFSEAFAQGLRDILFVTVLIIVMFGMDVPLAGLLVASFPALIAIGFGYRAMARPALRTMQAVVSRMNAWIAENIAGMRENHLYRRVARRRAEFKDLTEAHQASVTRVIRSWALLRPAMMLASAIATALVLSIGYGRVLAGTITVGVLITFLQYTSRLWVPVRNLTQKFNLIQTALTAGERIFDILDTPSRMKNGPGARADLSVERGEIAFRDVRFRYPTKPAEVLKGISFSIASGQTLALVGDTGAGKTTIASLLSRFYDATSGAILVDGHDVRTYTLSALRGGMAIVPQDVVIFAGTIRENITLGLDVPDERVVESVRAVRAEHLIERFPDGLDHVLDEGGRTLSIGERQLLSFARALVFNRPILILDEATASVDTETELRIQDALGRLTEGRTSVIIAHRLSTIRDADLILVLREGEVVERGTHTELLALEGEYARLYRMHGASADDEART